MRARTLQIVVAVAALVALGGVGCGDKGGKVAPASPELARLVLVTPPSTLTRAGKTGPAAPGSLFAGDAIATGAGGQATLSFKGGRVVEIGENARFVIAQGAGEISLEIAEGLIVSRVGAGGAADQGGLALSILTPDGLSRVPADGELSVKVGGGATTIEVHTGEITFVGKDGRQKSARGGDKLEILLGEVKIVSGGGAPDAGPPAAVQLDAIVVSLSADRGQVLVKGEADKKFRPVGKGEDAKLANGTAFKLAPGGRGLLVGGSLKMRLGGGAEGTLVKAEREADGGEHYHLSLSKGNAQVYTLGAAKRTLKVEGPKGDIDVRADDAATFTLLREGKTARAEVQAGAVELTYQGATRTVSAGEVAELAKGLTVSSKGKPALVVPAGRRVRVWANGLREVGLSWPADERARRVEVSTDSSFKEPLVAGKAVGTVLSVPAPASGDLFWRVVGATDDPLTRGHVVIAPEKIVATVGGHPVNEVAETGLKATVYYQSALPALVFSFPEVEGAARYRVRLFKASDLATPLMDKTVNEHKCAADPGKVGEGSYLWNATPLSASGAELAGGRMNKLDLVYDNAILSLTIEHPAPDEVASGPSIKTRGVAPLGSKLFINGKPAPLDPRGRFDLEVPRAPALVYRLVSSDASESYWIRSPRAR